ncbi:hypothetical protein HC928_01835 [bacterium]|nr:hypothetical protein [bacterium]
MNETQIFYGVVASVFFLAVVFVSVIVVIQRSSNVRTKPSPKGPSRPMNPAPDLRIPTGIWDSGSQGMYPPEPVPPPPAPAPVVPPLVSFEDQLQSEIKNLRMRDVATQAELHRKPRSTEYYVKLMLPEVNEIPQAEHELHVFISANNLGREPDWFLVRKYLDSYGEYVEHCLTCPNKFTGGSGRVGTHQALNEYGEIQPNPTLISSLLMHAVTELASAQPDPNLKLPHNRAKSYTESVH